MAENKEYISNELDHGTVYINEEVIATIAATAIRDVEGVVGLSGNLSDDVKGMLSKKNNSKGVRIILSEDTVSVECNLVVLYGHPVVEIAKNVQSGIVSAIESMTGLKVKSVDVNVGSISMAK